MVIGVHEHHSVHRLASATVHQAPFTQQFQRQRFRQELASLQQHEHMDEAKDHSLEPRTRQDIASDTLHPAGAQRTRRQTDRKLLRTIAAHALNETKRDSYVRNTNAWMKPKITAWSQEIAKKSHRQACGWGCLQRTRFQLPDRTSQ